MYKNTKRIFKILLAIILIIVPICIINYEADSEISQTVSGRWSNNNKIAQVSAFFSKEAEFSTDNILEIESEISKALEENNILQDDEKRIWVDCYSSAGKLTISKEKSEMELKAIGVGGDYFLFHPLELVSGSFFSEKNVMRDLVVIDEDTAWRLFGSVDIQGKTIFISGVEHTISGVIKRDKGKLNKEAENNVPTIYVSFDTLKKYGKETSITCFEVLLPNLTKNYGRNLIKSNLDYTSDLCEIVENSNRFSIISILKDIKNFENRSMKLNSIEYPYWENVARGKENICMVFMLIEIIIIFVLLIYLMINVVKLFKKYGKKFKYKVKNIIENIRINKNKKITTVIFDIGNVLAKFIPMEFLANLGYEGEKLEKVYEAVIENDIWNEYDSGIMTKDEVLEKFIERTPLLKNEILDVFSNLNGIVKRFGYTDKWIKDLKDKEIRVLYLSNISETLYRDCEDELNFVNQMNGGILSFEAKCIKPDREIYESLIEKYNLVSGECVFIDDREVNLEGAKKVGFSTILFTNYEETNSKLEKYIRKKL